MELAELGYFSRTHGVKGGLVLKCTSDFLIEEAETLFVEEAGSKMPCFITEVREAGQNIIVSLEGIDNVEQAKKLTGKKVFVASHLILPDEEGLWEGYELIEGRLGSIGRIESVVDNGTQMLITIRYKGREVILPVAGDLLEQVDDSAKKIYYNAPEGLIELYLDGIE